MSFWKQVEIDAGMGGHYPWVLLGSVVIALLLAPVAPDARGRLRVAVFLIGLSFGAMLACATMQHRGLLGPTAAGYRYIHFGSQLCYSIAVIDLLGVLIFRVLLTSLRFQPAPILRDTLLGLSYIIVALTLLSRHGVDLSGIVATSAVVTAVIGFSLQDTLGNIMGGVALQMEQSIGVGDWIRAGDIEGLVREIRWRQTSIETRNWDTVVIPNSVLMKSQVTVLGRRAGHPKLHRMWVDFNVDFRHPPVDVIDAVERALQSEAIPNVAPDPLPNCILREFKDSFGHYAVRYWLIDFAKDDPTSSEVRTRIFVALQRAGISLSIPAQSVFLTMEGRTRTERKQQEELKARATALKRVKIFEPLTDAELVSLAQRLTAAPFRQGEAITRQGNVAHYLYIIVKGAAEVQVIGLNGSIRTVARLDAGDVFGEMGLMTGEPRTATVNAMTDVICYRVEKEAFRDILHSRPEIAEAISHLLVQRKRELDLITHDVETAQSLPPAGHSQSEMLQRIRKFFTMG